MRDALPLPPFANLAAECAQVQLPATVEQHTEGLVLERNGELDRFLDSVEQRAFRAWLEADPDKAGGSP